jgi:hypothetical protein
MEGSTSEGARDPLFATCGADDAGDPNAFVTFGPRALRFLWRGYAHPAQRAGPGPRFDAATRVLAETLSPPLVAMSATGAVVCRVVVAIVDLE